MIKEYQTLSSEIIIYKLHTNMLDLKNRVQVAIV